jgi:bla regulator protein BlaR1
MNWKYIAAIAVIIVIGAAAWNFWPTPAPQDASDDVRNTVISFGGTLRSVSLLAPSEVLTQEMEEQYGPYVAPELLAQWEQDPTKAPGRLTSSPFPQGFYIASITKQADGTYRVDAAVQEVTSIETSAIVDKYGVTLVLQKMGDSWKVISFEKGNDAPQVPEPNL